MTAYQDLERRFRKISTLGEAGSMLHWDMAAMMPRGGAEARADQLALLATLGHQMICDPALADLFEAAALDTSLDQWQQANLREMRRSWVHATALDESLVEALSHATSKCERLWRDARPKSDFKAVQPALQEVLNLSKTAAAAKADKLGVNLYDALLDQYEPDGRSREIDVIFADLEEFLPPFLAQVLERQAQKPAPHLPQGPFAISAQKALGEKLMRALGFDFDHGRLDISAHPFCGGIPDDVRLTTRYDEGDFTTALMGVIHETGHALYERGLPRQWRGQPVGSARGMSLHESQSLLMEMQACRSPEFLRFALPLMVEAFNGQGEDWSFDNFLALYHQVEPGFIRVDADEVTYPAHVILRYRLERALIEDRMTLTDLPMAWNEGMKDLLGITPPDHNVGCMQDIHWYDGAWGYFPTYTLGAMTAAQIFNAAKTQVPSLLEAISQGDFSPLLNWLRPHIHGRASLLSSRDLLIEATGEPLNAAIFKEHLRQRYLS